MSARVTRRHLLRQAVRGAAAVPLLGLAACALDEAPVRSTVLSGTTMGTTYRITVPPTAGPHSSGPLHAAVRAILARIDAGMSTYRPDSELERFNRSGFDGWHDVSAETLAVVEQALETSRISGGAFDPTVGPLVDLWGFGPGPRTGRPPTREAIEALLPAVGAAGVETRRAPPGLRKRRPDVRLDLSGIAPGHALDQIAALLDGHGLSSYLVDLGGEFRARGERQPGAPWRLGIERPVPGRREIVCTLELGDEGLATSGDYRKLFEAGGRRYCHLIDPRRGAPVAHDLAAASVVAASVAEADAWATALMVLGPDPAIAFARERDLAALCIVREGGTFALRSTPSFDARRMS